MNPGDRFYLVNWGFSGMTRPFILKESALDQLKDKPEHLVRVAQIVTLEVVEAEPVTLHGSAPTPFAHRAMSKSR